MPTPHEIAENLITDLGGCLFPAESLEHKALTVAIALIEAAPPQNYPFPTIYQYADQDDVA